MNANTTVAVVEEDEVSAGASILSDQLIRLTSPQGRRHYPVERRRVVVWDADNEREIVLSTNQFSLAASTIAATHEERWQIEPFFWR